MGKRSRRSKKLTRHHNLAKSRGGSFLPNNIIHLSAKHHVAFHTLFGNRTVKEAIEVLERLEERIGGSHGQGNLL
jgi:hypothetical protein